MKFKRIILSFVAEAASNNAPTNQLREKAMSRMMTLLSERSHQSQSVGLFMMNKVTDNISFLLAIRQYFLSAVDNCDLDLTCGDEKRVKVMIRKLNSKDGVVSKVIYIRGLVSDDSGSNSRVSSIDTRDKLRSHLLCYPDGTDMEMHVCASELELLHFLRNSSESEEELNKVILITLDENNSVVKIHDDPDKNEIKEFVKNDKKATSKSARNKTSSNKNRKRKTTSTDSEKSNKNAKTTAATEPEQAEEARKTPEKTTTDTDEPPTVETTKKSSKKSKKSSKKSKEKDSNAPKKPLTAYLRWSKVNRDRIKEETPNLAFGDISKEMGKQWKKVPDEEKAALKAAYQEEKKIYDEQLEKYNNNNNNKNGESDKSKNAPKSADQTTNASASTSSKKKGRRKAASIDSEKANKAAKATATEEAIEAPKTPEKEKTTEKASTDTDESPIVETTKKSTKKSKAKDPNAPKKPVHYNAQYQKSIRSEVVEENPDLSSRDINKLTAKRYKEASDEELQPFKALYDANMKIYKKKIEEYQKKKDEGNDDENDVDVEVNQGNDDEKDVEENNKEETVKKTTKKGKKKKKNKSAIKKNVSAYMHFSRSKNPELKEKGIKPPKSGKVLGTLWRELPDSERAEFEEIAKKDKERYLKEVKEAKAAEELKSYLKKNWNSVPDPEV